MSEVHEGQDIATDASASQDPFAERGGLVPESSYVVRLRVTGMGSSAMRQPVADGASVTTDGRPAFFDGTKDVFTIADPDGQPRQHGGLPFFTVQGTVIEGPFSRAGGCDDGDTLLQERSLYVTPGDKPDGNKYLVNKILAMAETLGGLSRRDALDAAVTTAEAHGATLTYLQGFDEFKLGFWRLSNEVRLAVAEAMMNVSAWTNREVVLRVKHKKRMVDGTERINLEYDGFHSVEHPKYGRAFVETLYADQQRMRDAVS